QGLVHPGGRDDQNGTQELTRNRLLWCVFEPGRGSLQLSDAPVELCSAFVYCCLDLTSRGVRYPKPRDEGALGADFFHTLRERRHKLTLYVFFGDGLLTTAAFSSQVRTSSPGELSGLVASWLRKRRLDGMLFFYKSHRSWTLADDTFRAFARRIRDDLGRAGLFVSAVVSVDREDPRGSINKMLATFPTGLLVLRTHDASAQPRDEALCPMPFSRGPHQDSVSRLLGVVNTSVDGFDELVAPRLLFSVTFAASSYLLNDSGRAQEGSPALRLDGEETTFADLCDKALRLGYARFMSPRGDCLVVHKERLWHSGLGPTSTRIFDPTRRFAGALVFATHADDRTGRCGERHRLLKHIARALRGGP
ncbi:unnamed protein product, partial [Ixodes hexagonus]